MNAAEEPDGFAAFETWLGTPLPESPIEAMRILRRQAEEEIERQIAFLDAIDGERDNEAVLNRLRRRNDLPFLHS